MTKIRVMFVGQLKSGLPEDRIVNTFHFWDASTYDEAKADECRAAVIEFYNGGNSAVFPQTNSLASYLSPWLDRNAEVRSYDLDTAKPRVPTITEFVLGATIGSEGMPEECAITLSFQGAPPATARRRGRLFFGPVVTGTASPATTAHVSRPENFVLGDLMGACSRLRTRMLATTAWSIRSMLPTENYVPIVSAYADNAWDTQRRRGPDATERVFMQPPVL